jgi:hypothetical protein
MGVEVVVLMAVLEAVRARTVARRAADEELPYVPERWDREMFQQYGSWNAEAYDAGTGRDRSWDVVTVRRDLASLAGVSRPR